jgi:alpha-L-rhamnosidase
VPGAWQPSFLTDGQLTGAHGAFGYTSFERHGADLDTSIWVQLDLGADRSVDQVLLYPRTDLQTADGQVPNFPVDYTIQTAPAADGPFTVATRVAGQQPPAPPGPAPAALPILAKQFTISGPVASARLYLTGLGQVDATLNGKPVSDAVLQPPNTDYAQRVVYATYDLTHALRPGSNALGAMLGNGLYNVPSTPGRYEKLTRSDGPPKLLAQLEISYRDGHRQVIASDDSWRATLGPVTFSNWYGSEDVDARRTPAGWDTPDADLTGWDTAVAIEPPSPDTILSAQAVPPVRVIETVHPQAITQPKPGVWVADFGHQLAGWEQLRVAGQAGTTVTVRPAERLAPDGTALQDGGTGAPFWDSYTLSGRDAETWHPRFVYHGFRYLQLEGMPATPTANTVSALVLRLGNEEAGSFDSSDGLLNGIHDMLAQAEASNTLLFGSDPNREKLGWLADYAFAFPSISRDFDVAAYYRLLVQDMADAQTKEGLIPDIAPEYTVFGGGFRDDPNWGSAIVRAVGSLPDLRRQQHDQPVLPGHGALLRLSHWQGARWHPRLWTR